MDKEVKTEETKETSNETKDLTEEQVSNAFYGDKKPESDESKEQETKEVSESNKTEDTESNEKKDEGEKKEDDATEDKKDSKEDETDFDIKLKKDSILNKYDLEDVVEFAKENKLSKDQATAILDKQEALVNSFLKAQNTQHDKNVEDWRQEIQTDPEYGGEKLKANSENAKRVVQKYGSKEFINLLNETGYGDNPEVFKFLSKLGGLMSDDNLIVNNTTVKKERTAEEIFYGNSN